MGVEKYSSKKIMGVKPMKSKKKNGFGVHPSHIIRENETESNSGVKRFIVAKIFGD